MTRRDAVWAAAFAQAARHAPAARFADVPLGGGGYSVERTEMTPAEVGAHCAAEADRAVALFDAWEARPC